MPKCDQKKIREISYPQKSINQSIYVYIYLWYFLVEYQAICFSFVIASSFCYWTYTARRIFWFILMWENMYIVCIVYIYHIRTILYLCILVEVYGSSVHRISQGDEILWTWMTCGWEFTCWTRILNNLETVLTSWFFSIILLT